MQVLLRHRGRRTRQPAVNDRLPKRLLGDGLQLDQNCRVPVEVRDSEESLGIGLDQRLFLFKVHHTDRDDRPRRRGRVAKPLDICLAERPIPGERLASNGPRAVAMALAFGDQRQVESHLRDIVDGDHAANGTAPPQVRTVRFHGQTGKR